MQVSRQNRIKELRQANGLKLRHIAVELDVGEPQVSRYERGENTIPTQKAIQLARFFGVSLDYLLGVDEPEPTEAAA